MSRAAQFPLLYPQTEYGQGSRLVNVFEYAIFYKPLPEGDGIRVLRAIHGGAISPACSGNRNIRQRPARHRNCGGAQSGESGQERGPACAGPLPQKSFLSEVDAGPHLRVQEGAVFVEAACQLVAFFLAHLCQSFVLHGHVAGLVGFMAAKLTKCCPMRTLPESSALFGFTMTK